MSTRLVPAFSSLAVAAVVALALLAATATRVDLVDAFLEAGVEGAVVTFDDEEAMPRAARAAWPGDPRARCRRGQAHT